MSRTSKYYLIDFDSTFVKAESLDILGEISLAGNPDKETILAEIKRTTDAGMSGALPLQASLAKRLSLLSARRAHLPQLINRLQQEVSDSIKSNKAFFEQEQAHIYIISNGFHEFIEPIVADFGITASHVLANNFVFDAAGNIVDFNRHNVLASNQGKAKKVAELQLAGEVWMIGDGYTDYEVKAAGQADKFIAYTENISRPQVVARADFIANKFDDIIFLSNG